LFPSTGQWLHISQFLVRHLELALHGLQAAEEVLGFAEYGEEPGRIPVNHDAEDKLLPLGADSLELVRDGDEPLHLPEVARSHFLEGRTELQAALPKITKRERFKKYIYYNVVKEK